MTRSRIFYAMCSLLAVLSLFSTLFPMEKGMPKQEEAVDFSQTKKIKEIVAKKRMGLENLMQKKQTLEQEKTRREQTVQSNPSIADVISQEIERMIWQCDETIQNEEIELHLFEIAVQEIEMLFNDSMDLKTKLAEHEDAAVGLSSRLKELHEKQVQRDDELQELRSKRAQDVREAIIEITRTKSRLEDEVQALNFHVAAEKEARLKANRELQEAKESLQEAGELLREVPVLREQFEKERAKHVKLQDRLQAIKTDAQTQAKTLAAFEEQHKRARGKENTYNKLVNRGGQNCSSGGKSLKRQR